MQEQLKPFIAGFDLAGKRLPNGKLESYLCDENGKRLILDDWPQEVQLFSNTYTLEEVVKGTQGYESAVYV